MKHKSFSAYDDEDFFEKYTQKRSRGNSPNELIEQPIMDELIGEVSGKEILDLGCGDGKYGVKLLKRNAKYYHGIEGSKNMAALAREHLSNLPATIQEGDIEVTELLLEEYDLVISRLVLHYIEDLGKLMNRIHASMKEGGEFVFSIEHPIITSCYEAYHQKTKRGNWIVDNYFDSGERVNHWIGKEVVKYHKTLEEYWQIITQSNFKVVNLRESKPLKSNFVNIEEYQRRKRIPLFLMFKLRKE